MAAELPPCCERARQAYVKRLVNAIVSYPVIKNIPCPTCRRVIPIRLYAPPADTNQHA
jgi:hypothetical protein